MTSVRPFAFLLVALAAAGGCSASTRPDHDRIGGSGGSTGSGETSGPGGGGGAASSSGAVTGSSAADGSGGGIGIGGAGGATGSGGATGETASSSASSSSGGGGSPCAGAVDCPGPSPADECRTATCIGGVCGLGNVAAGACTDATDPLAKLCGDPQGARAGTCVECNVGPDCDSGVCQASVCQAPGCGDGVPNGDETDEDCGGSCGPCPDTFGCRVGADCQSKVCDATAFICTPVGCDDGVQNGLETDQDCGGALCDAAGKTCALGLHCLADADCGSSSCHPKSHTCVFPSCMDGARNGDETDEDCGGTVCGATCMTGQACSADGDCVSLHCVTLANAKACAAPRCDDGIKNQGEPAIDCGGPCSLKCPNASPCVVDADCAGGHCYVTNGGSGAATCHPDLCSDGAKDGAESSADCGGPTCSSCIEGQACSSDSDCATRHCSVATKLCVASSCSDGVQDGDETGKDCGGSCPACPNGRACLIDADCVTNNCDVDNVCRNSLCADGVNDLDETGVDCGGPDCARCSNGQACILGSDCASHACPNGTCVGGLGDACITDSGCFTGVCLADVCSQINGCDETNVVDLTGGAPVTVTFPNGNFTEAPRCIRVTVGTMVTYSGDFAAHPLQGGRIAGGLRVDDTSGPFACVTNTGTSKTFTMATAGRFGTFCTAHGPDQGEAGAVFVVP